MRTLDDGMERRAERWWYGNAEFDDNEVVVKSITRLLRKVAREAEKREREANIEAVVKWGRERGLQFGCVGSLERSGAMHRGNGTQDCPRALHHHHDDRCVGPADAIRNRRSA